MRASEGKANMGGGHVAKLTSEEIADIDAAGAKGPPKPIAARPSARIALFVLLGLSYYFVRAFKM